MLARHDAKLLDAQRFKARGDLGQGIVSVGAAVGRWFVPAVGCHQRERRRRSKMSRTTIPGR
jgi:hypothetical protein